MHSLQMIHKAEHYILCKHTEAKGEKGIYIEVWICRRSTFTIILRIVLFHRPVETTIGRPFFAACSNNGKLLASPDPILINGTSIESKKSTDTWNNVKKLFANFFYKILNLFSFNWHNTVHTISIEEAVKSIPTSFENFFNSRYCWYENSMNSLCSP